MVAPGAWTGGKTSSRASSTASPSAAPTSRDLALGLSRGGGLVRGEDGLRVNMMAELPGNVFLANIMDMANVSVCATDDVTKCVRALVYYFDPENEECKIAYTRICSSTATSSTAAA